MPYRRRYRRSSGLYGLGVPKRVLKMLNAECILQLVNGRIVKIAKQHDSAVDRAVLSGDLMRIEAAKATRDGAEAMLETARANLIRKAFIAAGLQEDVNRQNRAGVEAYQGMVADANVRAYPNPFANLGVVAAQQAAQQAGGAMQG